METKTSFTIIRTRVGRPCNFSSAAHRAGRASRSIDRSFRAFAATKDPERESRQRDRSCGSTDHLSNDRPGSSWRGTPPRPSGSRARTREKKAPKQQAQLVLAASALFDSP